MIIGFASTASIRQHGGGGGVSPIGDPISVALDGSQATPEPHQMTLKWGGYYAKPVAGGFKVFRLIDLNEYTYHLMSYNELFLDLPDQSDVDLLVPANRHITGSSVEFVAMKPVLLGSDQLDKFDLDAYVRFLKKEGFSPDEYVNFKKRVIDLSKEDEFETLLAVHGDEIHFEHAIY